MPNESTASASASPAACASRSAFRASRSMRVASRAASCRRYLSLATSVSSASGTDGSNARRAQERATCAS
jgi:hypothetical protein